MHRVTDYYGPIIYKNFANEANHYRPDTQKDVYYEFFNELDSAVVALTGYNDPRLKAYFASSLRESPPAG